MDNKDLSGNQEVLFIDIQRMIEDSRQKLGNTVNLALTLLYWHIGKRINEEVLKNERAEYGQKILQTLSTRLVEEYGKSYQEKNLRRMVQFAQVYHDFDIVASLMRQLSWTHFTLLIPLKREVEREFYAQMCRLEQWSVRTLRKKIQSMLFERTAISQKPEELAKLELKALREEGELSPDLVFRNPYILDFLGLKQRYAAVANGLMRGNRGSQGVSYMALSGTR